MPFVELERVIHFTDGDRDRQWSEEEYRAAGELCRAALGKGGRPYGDLRCRRVSAEGDDETWVFELDYLG